MIALLLTAAALTAPATAAPLPVQLDVDAAMGMRAGGTVLATVTPWAQLDAGVYVSVMTDLYAFAPEAVTWGLERERNLHVATMAALGWHTAGERWSVGLYGLVGPEVVRIVESKQVPALDAPVSYEHTDVALRGGLLPTLRWQPGDRWGANLQIMVPLPRTPTGKPALERLHLAAGVTWRL